MNSIAALADIGKEVKTQEIEYNAPIIAEFIDYIRWLADQDTSLKITVGQVWELFYEGLRVGRVWSEVCEDIGLPVREDWE
jgi:hypothetical protein